VQTLLSGFGQGCVLLALAVVSDDIGLIDALRVSEGKSVELLACELELDLDRLQACLELLEHLGCVERSAAAAFRSTPQADELPQIASACRGLLSADVPSMMARACDMGPLPHWLSQSSERWCVADATIASCMDGLLLVTLLCALPQPGGLEDQEAGQWLADLPADAAQVIEPCLRDRGWLEATEQGATWTQEGRALWAEISDMPGPSSNRGCCSGC